MHILALIGFILILGYILWTVISTDGSASDDDDDIDGGISNSPPPPTYTPSSLAELDELLDNNPELSN